MKICQLITFLRLLKRRTEIKFFWNIYWILDLLFINQFKLNLFLVFSFSVFLAAKSAKSCLTTVLAIQNLLEIGNYPTCVLCCLFKGSFGIKTKIIHSFILPSMPMLEHLYILSFSRTILSQRTRKQVGPINLVLLKALLLS